MAEVGPAELAIAILLLTVALAGPGGDEVYLYIAIPEGCDAEVRVFSLDREGPLKISWSGSLGVVGPLSRGESIEVSVAQGERCRSEAIIEEARNLEYPGERAQLRVTYNMTLKIKPAYADSYVFLEPSIKGCLRGVSAEARQAALGASGTYYPKAEWVGERLAVGPIFRGDSVRISVEASEGCSLESIDAPGGYYFGGLVELTIAGNATLSLSFEAADKAPTGGGEGFYVRVFIDDPACVEAVRSSKPYTSPDGSTYVIGPFSQGEEVYVEVIAAKGCEVKSASSNEAEVSLSGNVVRVEVPESDVSLYISTGPKARGPAGTPLSGLASTLGGSMPGIIESLPALAAIIASIVGAVGGLKIAARVFRARRKREPSKDESAEALDRVMKIISSPYGQDQGVERPVRRGMVLEAPRPRTSPAKAEAEPAHIDAEHARPGMEATPIPDRGLIRAQHQVKQPQVHAAPMETPMEEVELDDEGLAKLVSSGWVEVQEPLQLRIIGGAAIRLDDQGLARLLSLVRIGAIKAQPETLREAVYYLERVGELSPVLELADEGHERCVAALIAGEDRAAASRAAAVEAARNSSRVVIKLEHGDVISYIAGMVVKAVAGAGGSIKAYGLRALVSAAVLRPGIISHIPELLLDKQSCLRRLSEELSSEVCHGVRYGRALAAIISELVHGASVEDAALRAKLELPAEAVSRVLRAATLGAAENQPRVSAAEGLVMAAEEHAYFEVAEPVSYEELGEAALRMDDEALRRLSEVIASGGVSARMKDEPREAVYYAEIPGFLDEQHAPCLIAAKLGRVPVRPRHFRGGRGLIIAETSRDRYSGQRPGIPIATYSRERARELASILGIEAVAVQGIVEHFAGRALEALAKLGVRPSQAGLRAVTAACLMAPKLLDWLSSVDPADIYQSLRDAVASALQEACHRPRVRGVPEAVARIATGSSPEEVAAALGEATIIDALTLRGYILERGKLGVRMAYGSKGEAAWIIEVSDVESTTILAIEGLPGCVPMKPVVRGAEVVEPGELDVVDGPALVVAGKEGLGSLSGVAQGRGIVIAVKAGLGLEGYADRLKARLVKERLDEARIRDAVRDALVAAGKVGLDAEVLADLLVGLAKPLPGLTVYLARGDDLASSVRRAVEALLGEEYSWIADAASTAVSKARRLGLGEALSVVGGEVSRVEALKELGLLGK